MTCLYQNSFDAMLVASQLVSCLVSLHCTIPSSKLSVATNIEHCPHKSTL